MCLFFPPVEAATAPTRTGGIPSMAIIQAAAKHVNWAVLDEEADSVLWWKHWNDRLPRPWGKEVKESNRNCKESNPAMLTVSANITSIKKSSIHLQTMSFSREPSHGSWKVWLKAVWTMFRDEELSRRKGTHSHWNDTTLTLTNQDNISWLLSW